jgi:RNA-directed DNA polymerase
MPGTSRPETVSTRQQRIATLAKQSPEMGFTSLNQHLDLTWLYEAYARTRKDGAPGIDGQTGADYEVGLYEKLQSLLDRAQSGTYRAPPVRRRHIPKGTSGDTRPIGIPTFEDKVLQRGVVMILEAIYEQDFSESSFGFRPGRSAHQALEVLRNETMRTAGGWMLEVDIRKFFDMLDHSHLRQFLRLRVRDGVLLRLIDKWLNAGVLEDGVLTHPDEGSPQGGVISPLLANIYLHYVLDDWFANEVEPRLKGRAFLIRYADDFVLGFTREEDARQVLSQLAERFGQYGLTLHPEKTRLVRFQHPQRRGSLSDPSPPEGPGTFDLLGFTHYWGRTRKGGWVVKRKTAADRLRRALRKIAQWCRLNRHLEIAVQHQKLCQKIRGHYAYYGITGNFYTLSEFLEHVTVLWQKWLSRRTRKSWLAWPAMRRLLACYPLPPAKIVHAL